MIYHIASIDEWSNCENEDAYTPSRFGKEGFIHCSNKKQIHKTANILFKTYTSLLLLFIDDKKEALFIKYENLEGGKELFPHIYRKLPKISIVKVQKMCREKTGYFNPEL